MSVLLCPKCSTRNPHAASVCRRCGAPLSDGVDMATQQVVAQHTLKGIPVSEALLDGRWMIETPLALEDNLFIGRDMVRNERVMIKRLPEHIARDRVQRSRFLQEAKLLLTLSHPNVLRAIDLIEDHPRPALVLEYRPRESARLDAVLSHHERLPLTIALLFFRQLLAGLAHVHERGVLHRKLSPTAVLVREGPERGAPLLELTDFGLAHVRPSSPELGKRSGTLMGMRAGDDLLQIDPTPYMAPEMLAMEATRRSDLYGAAVIFFQLCTGQLPLGGTSVAKDALARQIMNQPSPPLRQLLPHASQPLEALLLSLLHKDPRARPASAPAVLEAISVLPELEHRDLVFIPMGDFLQGSSRAEPGARPEEQPRREVSLDAFYIDRFPVTVADFHAFLRATRYDIPRNWYTFNDIQNHPDHPVVYVNWFDASAYARWAGKRLPSESEWEKSARSEDGRPYPWGERPPDGETAWFGGKTHPISVRKHPLGASPYGVLDLAGNAFEWVADWYARRYYSGAPGLNPLGPEEGTKRVLKGGSFAHPDYALRCAVRGRYRPEERRANHSFRCAWSLRRW